MVFAARSSTMTVPHGTTWRLDRIIEPFWRFSFDRRQRTVARVSTAVEPRDPFALVERILKGDSTAEGELYQQYRRGVAMILRHSFGGGMDAEDYLQETFYLAIRKIREGELREPARLPQFLASLARNLTINHFRKEKRRRTEADSERLDREPTSGNQYERVARRERAQRVHEVLAELRNPRDQELLYRFYIAEEEKEEICEDLGLSSLHFNRVLFRAKQRFRDLLDEAAPPTGVGG